MDESSWFRTRRAKMCITVSDNMVAVLSEKRNYPIKGEYERKEPVIVCISRLMLKLCV
jgi:hypothetical protein